MFLLTGVDLFDPREQLIVILWEEQGYDRHRSWQIRQPAPQSKLLKRRQRACSACFVPVMQKMQINRNFPLSQNVHPAKLLDEYIKRHY